MAYLENIKGCVPDVQIVVQTPHIILRIVTCIAPVATIITDILLIPAQVVRVVAFAHPFSDHIVSISLPFALYVSTTNHGTQDFIGSDPPSIFFNTSIIRVQSNTHFTIQQRLDGVMDRTAVAGSKDGGDTSLWPSITVGLHQLILVVVPETVALVFEELFQPFIVIGFLEESQQCKVGVWKVAIHRDTALAVLVVADRAIPLVALAIVILVLPSAVSRIVLVHVL